MECTLWFQEGSPRAVGRPSRCGHWFHRGSVLPKPQTAPAFRTASSSPVSHALRVREPQPQLRIGGTTSPARSWRSYVRTGTLKLTIVEINGTRHNNECSEQVLVEPAAEARRSMSVYRFRPKAVKRARVRSSSPDKTRSSMSESNRNCSRRGRSCDISTSVFHG